ncbi:MAG: flagellar filament capping protein FliD [Anaerolineaceae bacterium]
MSTSVSALNSTFTTLISSMMDIERQPLEELEEKKNALSIQQAVYTDLNKMLSEFQSAAFSLTSTNVNYSFASQRKAIVSNVATGTTVLTATASTKAVPAQYQVSVTNLAKEHRVRSDRQASVSEELGYTGSFLLSGDVLSKATLTVSDSLKSTIAGAEGAEIENGQNQLTSGTYSVETRYDTIAGWQFRMIDSSNNALSIRKADGSYSSDWQSISSGVHDTGRGMKLTFGSDPGQYAAGTAQIAFEAKGTKITVSADDSLLDVAYAINNATYETGDEVVANIVDNQLILSRKTTGSGHVLIAHDQEGSILAGIGILNGNTFKNQMQTPSNAAFSVNNIAISRSQNSSLTDVIQGVTVNLAADAEGKTATIDVKYDPSGEKSVLNTFISKFNNLQAYLSGKLAVTKQSDGTYQRGSLSGDTMFQSLRMELIQNVLASTTNSGIFKNIGEIGISISDSFSLSITDSAKLEKALSESKQSVTTLLDSVMIKLNSKLARFLGTSGYVTTASNALTSQLKMTNDQITSKNAYLTKKEESLRTRYAQIQAELMLMTYQQDQMDSIYGVLDQYS